MILFLPWKFAEDHTEQNSPASRRILLNIIAGLRFWTE